MLKPVRAVWVERQRWFGLLAAVVVSVAFVTATLALGGLTRSTLDGALDGRFGGVDVVLRAGGGQEIGGAALRAAVPGDVASAMAASGDLVAVAGVIEGAATVLGRDGRPIDELFGAGTVATNWLVDPELAGVEIVEGRAPVADGEVVLDTGTAAVAGVVPGDEVRVDFPVASRRLTVVGVAAIVRDGEIVPGPRLVWMDEPTTRSALDKSSGFDFVIGRAGGDLGDGALERLRSRIGSELGADSSADSDSSAGVEVVTGSTLVGERQAVVRRIAEFFDRPMMASGFIAVFVGAFVIFNTFSIVMAQRVRELGMLRAIGATRAQVTRTVLSEAVVIGVVGSVAGLAAGWLAAWSTRSVFATALDLPDGPLGVGWGSVIAAFATGLGSTLVAGIVPAVRAGSTSPMSVLRSTQVDDTYRWGRRHWSGLALLVAGVTLISLILTGAAELGLAGIGVGSAAVFIAFAMVGSAVVGPVFGWVGRPLVAWQGLTARLAIRSAARSPGRTTLVIVALSIGIAMMTVITTFEASVRAATEDRAAGQLAGIDLLVESPVGVPRTVAARLSELDGIDAVTPVRLGVMTVLNSYDAAQARDAAGVDAATASSAVPPIGAAKFLTGVDLDAASRMIEVPGLSPPITHLDDGEVMVLAKTAERAGWRVGDDVEVWFATTGRATLRLAATFTGRFGVDAEYVANLATTSSNAPPEFSGDSVVWAKADDRASVPEVVAAARRELRALAPGASVTSIQEYLGQRMTGINSLINLLVVLVGVSVLVAWVGVANTVALALRERRTETTRLRAVGLTRSQFHRTVVIETLLIAVFGSALGVVTGWSMAAGFITSMGEEGLRPVVDPVSIGGIALLGALAAIATAAYQARRVSGPVLPAGR